MFKFVWFKSWVYCMYLQFLFLLFPSFFFLPIEIFLNKSVVTVTPVDIFSLSTFAVWEVTHVQDKVKASFSVLTSLHFIVRKCSLLVCMGHERIVTQGVALGPYLHVINLKIYISLILSHIHTYTVVSVIFHMLSQNDAVCLLKTGWMLCSSNVKKPIFRCFLY